MIEAIIFDLDDTICDFSGAKKFAKMELSKVVLSLSANPDEYWAQFDVIEYELFSKYASKEIELRDYRYRRFSDPFLNLGVPRKIFEDHINSMNAIYMNICNNEIRFINDAVPALLNIARRNIHTCILTNGPSTGQRSKINSLFLSSIIDDFYISSEIGYAKPDSSAFAYVHQKLKLPKESILMVGDSAYYDYFPAKKFGFNSILLDREGLNNSVNDTDKIESLMALKDRII